MNERIDRNVSFIYYLNNNQRSIIILVNNNSFVTGNNGSSGPLYVVHMLLATTKRTQDSFKLIQRTNDSKSLIKIMWFALKINKGQR